MNIRDYRWASIVHNKTEQRANNRWALVPQIEADAKDLSKARGWPGRPEINIYPRCSRGYFAIFSCFQTLCSSLQLFQGDFKLQESSLDTDSRAMILIRSSRAVHTKISTSVPSGSKGWFFTPVLHSRPERRRVGLNCKEDSSIRITFYDTC